MLDAIKKIDKKLLIILSVVLLVPIFIIVLLIIIQGCSNTKMSYDKYEKAMLKSAEKYFDENKLVPTLESDYVVVQLDTLVTKGYIKSPEKALKDSTCTGYVSVRRNGSSIETNEGGFLNYTYDLKCSNYSTVHLSDKIKENIVNDNSAGLYETDFGYIFKGESPKNYITFYGVDYRIVSIDNNNIIKLVKVESEATSRLWDNKYNIDVNNNYGINKYSDSLILKYLLSDYENKKKISKKAKQHVIAYDVCIGKRSSEDYSIDHDKDCSEVLEDQLISLLNISDFALASLDSNCKDLKSKSCRNYNYLYKVASSTWTTNASSDNTYEVLTISNGLMDTEKGNIYNGYNFVIYIDGDELYTEGTGTSEKPYIIDKSK